MLTTHEPEKAMQPSAIEHVADLYMVSNDTQLRAMCFGLAIDQSDGDKIAFASIVGDTSTVKAFHAAFASRAKIRFNLEDGYDPVNNYFPSGKLNKYRKYQCRTESLGYHKTQLIVRAEDEDGEDRFIPYWTPETFWRKVTGPDYTTPVIPEVA